MPYIDKVIFLCSFSERISTFSMFLVTYSNARQKISSPGVENFCPNSFVVAIGDAQQSETATHFRTNDSRNVPPGSCYGFRTAGHAFLAHPCCSSRPERRSWFPVCSKAVKRFDSLASKFLAKLVKIAPRKHTLSASYLLFHN